MKKELDHLAGAFEDFKIESREYRKETQAILINLIKKVEHIDATRREIDGIREQISDIYSRLWKVAALCSTIAGLIGLASGKLF